MTSDPQKLLRYLLGVPEIATNDQTTKRRGGAARSPVIVEHQGRHR